MTLMPGKPVYRTGENITLSCSADSSPVARIWWMFNGTEINKTGSDLHLQNVTESDSGDYRCILYNNVTSILTSESKTIKIMGKFLGMFFF